MEEHRASVDFQRDVQALLLANLSPAAMPPPSGGPEPLEGAMGEWVLLVLSGSFNPIHVGHLDALVTAAAALNNAQGKHRRRVIGGVLAPSSDSYVINKLGSEAIPLAQRTQLCRMAAERDKGFFVVAGHGHPSGSHMARLVATDATAALAELVENRRVAPPPTTSIHAIPLYGSDFAVRYPVTLSKPYLICARQDDDGTARILRRMIDEAHPSEVHPQFLFLGDVQIESVSSTRVRSLVAAITAEDSEGASEGVDAEAQPLAPICAAEATPPAAVALPDRNLALAGDAGAGAAMRELMALLSPNVATRYLTWVTARRKTGANAT